ncbi:MAG TPA: metallophosphatase [Candidatus Paraprevotella stercorigallinarum]|jgi:5'-nucleotidase|nr:metallophosphatase [Candidatus Paraprevotella stercorigallinarum]
MKIMMNVKEIGRSLLAILSLVISVEAGAQDLWIVHTNDTHSCVMPINPLSSDTAQADKGGFLRRASFVRQMREEHPHLLLFDSGDFSQGSAYYNLYKGEVEVSLMNEMKYDAATIGNHEFDFGMDNMKRIYSMAQFPIVCANYDFSGTVLEGLVKPYVILEREGLRIGVFGLSPQMDGLVSAENYKGVKFEDPVSAAERVVGLLRGQEHCDVVICLSHLGWDIEGIDDVEVIPATRDIDVVLGGHSHTYFEHPEIVKNADGKDVICNQMGKNGRYVGVLHLHVDPAGN